MMKIDPRDTDECPKIEYQFWCTTENKEWLTKIIELV